MFSSRHLAGDPPDPSFSPNWQRVEATTSPDIAGVAEQALRTLEDVYLIGAEDRLLLKLFASSLRGGTPASEQIPGNISVDCARHVREDGTVLLENELFQLVPYGSESVGFRGPCHICNAQFGSAHSSSCPMGPGAIYERPARCRDCGVPAGSIHILTCCIEECPRCPGQYMSCDCNGEEDAPDDDSSEEW